MKTTLNIGLENNAHFRDYAVTDSVSTIISQLRQLGDVVAFRIVTSEWEGNPERTLVVELGEVRMGWICFEIELEHLCDVFTQQCIAYRSEHNDMESLVYGISCDDMPEEERHEFDPRYFVEM